MGPFVTGSPSAPSGGQMIGKLCGRGGRDAVATRRWAGSGRPAGTAPPGTGACWCNTCTPGQALTATHRQASQTKVAPGLFEAANELQENLDRIGA